jgi:hypothetical protein
MANRQRRMGAIDPVEQAGIESFPASDPPGWVPLRLGSPSRSANLRDLRRQKRGSGDRVGQQGRVRAVG